MMGSLGREVYITQTRHLRTENNAHYISTAQFLYVTPPNGSYIWASCCNREGKATKYKRKGTTGAWILRCNMLNEWRDKEFWENVRVYNKESKRRCGGKESVSSPFSQLGFLLSVSCLESSAKNNDFLLH